MNIVYIKIELLIVKTSITDLGEYFASAGWTAYRHLEVKLKTNKHMLTGGVCVYTQLRQSKLSVTFQYNLNEGVWSSRTRTSTGLQSVIFHNSSVSS